MGRLGSVWGISSSFSSGPQQQVKFWVSDQGDLAHVQPLLFSATGTFDHQYVLGTRFCPYSAA